MRVILLLTRLTTCFITLLLLSFVVVEAAYAYATFYFVPQRKTLGVHVTQAIQLRLNTDGEDVNAFAAYISYPSDIIDVSLKEVSLSFAVAAEETVGGGSIRLARGAYAPVNGDVAIATFVIKGKKEGHAAFSFQEGSGVARYNDSTDALSLPRSIGGSYTIVVPQTKTVQTQTQPKTKQKPTQKIVETPFLLQILNFVHNL